MAKRRCRQCSTAAVMTVNDGTGAEPYCRPHSRSYRRTLRQLDIDPMIRPL